MGDVSEQPVPEGWVTLAEASRQLAESHLAQNDWSGLPVPVDGLNLILEPRYKHKSLSEFRWSECYENGVRRVIEKEPLANPSEFKIVNSWWNSRYQVTVGVAKDKRGQVQLRIWGEDRLAFTIRTLEAAVVWPMEAEKKAHEKLAGLIPSDQFEIYVLTGHFAEISKRSKLTYLFRRGRPTVVLRQDNEFSFALCALCLHPIGYYGDTWAGVMCPTDEVIAHLLMMRGSEHKFWANANQHPIDRPAAGV